MPKTRGWGRVFVFRITAFAETGQPSLPNTQAAGNGQPGKFYTPSFDGAGEPEATGHGRAAAS